jgi:hypothetical protein
MIFQPPMQKLEDDIMRVWGITDDLSLILQMIGDDEFFGDLPAKHADKLMNILIGVKEMSDYKLNLLWDNYELSLRDYYKYKRTHDNKE